MELLKMRDEDYWNKARFMFETNMSFRQIELELSIPKSTLHRRGLKEQWQKGLYMPLVLEIARAEEAFQGLSAIKKKAVMLEVQRKLKLRAQYEEHPNIWLKKLLRQ